MLEVEKGSMCLPVTGPIEAADSNPRLAEIDGDPLMIAEKVSKEGEKEVKKEVEVEVVVMTESYRG